MRIFISGPYSGKTPEEVHLNVCRALDAAQKLIGKGHCPFIPHLTHFLHLYLLTRHGQSFDYETWMELDEAWLRCCAAILHLGTSPGADRELAMARALGLVVYRAVDEVPDAS